MKLDRQSDKDMNHQHSKYQQVAWLIGLLLILVTKAWAMYALTDIEVVPTKRLIANLEKKLAAAPVESDLFRSGERIKIWSWGQLPIDGDYTIDTNGFVNFPRIGKVKLAGRTKAAVVIDLNGGKRPGDPGGRGIFLEQSWGQRNGRVQPGETAELHYELGRVYSIDYALAPSKFEALRGGDRPFLGNGARSGLPPDPDRFSSDGPVDPHRGAETNTTVLKDKLRLAITHYRETLRRKPDHLPAQLGLAWCLDQAKSKAAVEEYRKALSLAWKQEKDQSSILENSWVEEIARYLLPLLDPVGD